ncbi:MAG: hypothetical protein Q4D02_07870 [Clostridia bacterium]|nr:hypothetical protein [Clostridia bacterium]
MGNDKSGGIFSNWLKNFSIIVFTQAFHAVFLMFIMKFLSIVSGGSVSNADGGNFAEKQGILAIVSIAGMWGLIKLEKFVKGLFGIQESKMMGGIGENLGKSMMAIRSGIDLAKRTKEPFDKHKEAQKNVEAKRKAYNRALDMQKAGAKSNAAAASTNVNSAIGGTTSNQNLNVAGNNPALGAGSGNGVGNVQLTDDALNRLIMALENNSAALQQGASNSSAANDLKNQWAVDDAYKELQDAQRDEEAWRKKRVTRLATTVAAGAMGIGATDNIGDAVTFANLADKPMDWYTDRKVDKTANINTAKRIKKDYDATQDQLKKINDSYNNVTNNGTREVSAATKAQYKRVQEKYTKQAQSQAAAAQSYLNEIPNNVLAEASKTWLEMTDSTPVKVSKREGKFGYAPSLNSSFNKTVKREVRDTINDVRRKPIQRNIDNVDDL